jgi:cobalamin biosynthesis Mg chelatase CobN
VAPTPGGPASPASPAKTTPAAPQATPGQPAPAATTPQPSPAPAPAAAASDGAIERAARTERASGRSDGLPAAIVGIGILALVLALVGLLWLIARALAWEPRWWPRARHACQEAGWRVSGTWEDFTDWVRLGR